MRRMYWAATLAAFVLAMPLAALADDQLVANQIAESLKTSGRMRDYKVGVTVQDGTAWLKGTVANDEQWTTAQMIAEDVYGVDRVVNELTIGGGAGEATTSRRTGSSLRQPDSVRRHMPAASNEGVVRASMELPDHAQQELAIAGPAPQLREELPAAPMAPPKPMRQPMASEPQAHPMARQAPPMAPANRRGTPLPMGARGPYQQVSQQVPAGETVGTPRPMPMHGQPMGMAAPAPMHYDSPSMPNYAWPSYAAHPNYAALTYPKQYSPTAWPYIGPFYPYPQVPLGWRKVTLEWDDGWWFLDFKDSH